MSIYKIPIGPLGEQFINYTVSNFKPFFDGIAAVILFIHGIIEAAFSIVPPWVAIPIVVFLTWRFASRSTGLFALISLSLIWNLRLWDVSIETLSLVITASLISLMIAIPLGILVAENRIAAQLMTPILDFLQTMPRFIYLIPGVIVFGIGTVPGIIATITLAIPPPIRLTALGLTQIDNEVIEAGEAFGCSRWQLLTKIKLPLSIPSIMLGVNQCIMMSLSMIVIAAMIGAGGLGVNILIAINRLRAGEGLEAGLGIVVIAIIIDGLAKGFVKELKN